MWPEDALRLRVSSACSEGQFVCTEGPVPWEMDRALVAFATCGTEGKWKGLATILVTYFAMTRRSDKTIMKTGKFIWGSQLRGLNP